MIREANKEKRVTWCQKQLENNEAFVKHVHRIKYLLPKDIM
jgi:hypothetical protein